MKRKLTRKMTTIVAGVTLAAFLMCGCTAPFGGKTEKEDESAAEEVEKLDVSVLSPEQKEITLSSNFAGTVVAESEVNVIPLTSGEVVEKNFEVGDHVNAGELLFKIDDTAYQIAVKQAEASVTTAQAGLTSAKAALDSSEANANTTRAKAMKDVGEIPYNEQAMNVKVDSDYVTKRQANNTFKNAKDNVDLMQNALDAAESARDSAKAEYERLKRSGTATEEELSAAKALYDQRDSTVDTAEYNLKTAKRAADSAEMTYALTGENYALDSMARDNYNTYTKPVTLYGAYASAVGADSSVTSSRATVTSSAAGVKQAEAGLENAKLNLDHTNVKAPVSGTITAINVTLHNMATQQGAAYTIQSDEPNKIVFYVAEETVKNIVPGAEAIISKNGTDYEGKIVNVYDTIDAATGLFKVEAAAVDPSAGAGLVSGSSVSIRTITRRTGKALTVPINAVYYDGEQAYVYVNDKGIAKRLDVATGLSDDESIEITGGLFPEAKVIVSWAGSLRDGTELNVKDISAGNRDAASGIPSGLKEPVTGDAPAMTIVAGAGAQ
ncbi:MAG: efflux RND transporter periplasmic adaptor subunit [Lachnospiraceae bacterium]|nr:efflux RND transporter periplasmic adaptor subunit [Lachnospiraceae bacterium]